MTDLSYGEFTAEKMKSILCASSGSRRVKFRYEIIRNGAVFGTLPVSAASVRWSKDAAIRRTARLTVGESEIEWLSDRIKIWMLVQLPDEVPPAGGNTWGDVSQYSWGQIARHTWGAIADGSFSAPERVEQWAEFPLGLFIPSTVTKNHDIENTYSVEAYDLSVILQEDAITDRLFFPAGTLYTAAVESVLVSAGVDRANIIKSNSALNTAREWAAGTAKLSIVNELLAEINYDSLSVSPDGIFEAKPYTAPTAENVSISYAADELSVLRAESATDLDAFSAPNVFVGIVSNPDYIGESDLPDSFSFTYTNNNPASPLSTVNRGRSIVEVLRPNDIASQEDLEDFVRRRAFAAEQVYETSAISTALMPIHKGGEVLAIQHQSVSGIFEETAWEMAMEAGGQMTHTVRRVRIV